MKLIIEVDEKRYEEIKQIANAQLELKNKTEAQIIANGTPLPKGHGDLIDKDELSPKIHGAKSIVAVLEAPAIIEADKENKKKSDELPSCNNCVHNGEWSSTGNCIKCSCFDRYEKRGNK